MSNSHTLRRRLQAWERELMTNRYGFSVGAQHSIDALRAELGLRGKGHTMTQEELDALPDVTEEGGALFMGRDDDGEYRCERTGKRWFVGERNGERVKQELPP